MNSYQAKVQETQQYSDSQGEHIVCKGKVLLLETTPKKSHSLWRNVNGQLLHTKTSTPEKLQALGLILISETEEIKEGDWVINEDSTLFEVETLEKCHNGDTIVNCGHENYSESWLHDCKKVLAFPEHFSDKHLQATADGKIKDRSEVLVKCGYKVKSGNLKDHKDGKAGYEYGEIYLNQQNYITLFPVK